MMILVQIPDKMFCMKDTIIIIPCMYPKYFEHVKKKQKKINYYL